MNPQNPKLVTATVLFFIAVFIIISCPLSSAHILDSARIQDWKDTENNLEIKFSYSPEKPIIDTFTKLEFSVTNFKTGEHIQNFIAHVTVINGQRLFKFQNITVQNGDFSVDYIFPDDGTHQVLLRIDRKDIFDWLHFKYLFHINPLRAF